MSVRWWNTGELTASRHNLQQQEKVPHRDSGVGNGGKPSVILNIMDN